MVKAQREELEGTGEIPQFTQTIGLDGKKRETPKKPPAKNKGGRPRKLISIPIAKPDQVAKVAGKG